MESNVVIATLFVIFGCCANVVFLEHLINASSSGGNMIVFFQFLTMSLEGFVFYSKFGKTKRIIPISNYIIMVMMYLSVSVTNILALNFHIPMPLHMIFKSGSLVANLLIGRVVLKRSYTSSKYLAVILVTIGIFICTIATSILASRNKNGIDEEIRSLISIMIGIFLLTFSLMMSARLGIYQETLFLKFGKQSREAAFYNHAIPLPFFVLLAPSILENVAILNQSELSSIPIVSALVTYTTGQNTVVMPILWQYMIGNLMTQYVCIRSIFYLTTVCTSLTVTLLVTLRKFVSLILSVIYFNNEFTFYHWFGTGLVLFGTLIYSNVVPWDSQKIYDKPDHKNGKTE